MLLAFSVYPYELLQLSPLFKHVVKLRLVGRNKVQRNELLKPRLPVYGYPRTYASVLLVMIITMVFSSIAPIIMPFSLLYFGLDGLCDIWPSTCGKHHMSLVAQCLTT